MLRRSLLIAFIVLAGLTSSAHAQRGEVNLSEKEVEELRDSAYVANDRVMTFIKLIDVRIKALQDMYAKPRRPGREQDTHDLLEQFAALADELNDNLDDYGPRHRDIRKALPKLIEATERWGTTVRTPPDNDLYNVSRKIALESIRDLREAATEMLDEQKKWFADHPPQKEEPAQMENHPR
ncbi:hypothetical protein [Edaphobacter flagellatus]|uniref:hypothetical protein n=1 Tax=Edaphobacter flagellatus TaxID=1933044 RepID=UPI0021B2EF41|nr:hypothetical protein [Edaphobacter flagellatus]